MLEQAAPRDGTIIKAAQRAAFLRAFFATGASARMAGYALKYRQDAAKASWRLCIPANFCAEQGGAERL